MSDVDTSLTRRRRHIATTYQEGTRSLERSLHPSPTGLRRRTGLLVEKGLRVSSRDAWRSVARGATWPAVLGPLLAVMCAALLWAISLPRIDPARMNDYGLVSVLPPTMYAAFLILTVSFCLAVYRRPTPSPLLLPSGWGEDVEEIPRRQRQAAPVLIVLLHVILLIVMIHGTPAIVYGTVRYSWAWKHVGIVDYIQRHGSVNPNIAYLNVYHNWPGFFALGALFTEVAGFTSALSLAGWAPVFFNLIDIGAVVMILTAITRDRRVIWLSVWFFYLANWVGQDYFSPQALAYFFYLVILGILLGWFGITTPPAKSAIKRWHVPDRYAYLIQRLATRMIPLMPPGSPGTARRTIRQSGLMLMMVLLFAVIVSSHQLTPFAAILAVAALVVLQRCSARSLPILMAVMTVGWVVFMAVAFLRGNLYWIIQSIGSPAQNANSTLINLSLVSRGMVFVALMSRGLTAFVWLLALLGFIRRRRHGYWDLTCIVLAVTPAVMLGGNSYGGEMLFRVYYFGLPFMAFFAASLLYPSPVVGATWRPAAVAVVLSGVLLFGLFFAYYGKDRMYYFTKNEVAAAQYLYTATPAGSLLIDANWDYPRTFRNYERYNYLTLLYLSKQQQARLRRDPVDVIARLMSDRRYPAAYFIVTRSEKAEVNMTAEMPPGSLDTIERALRRSPRFKAVVANPDATVFTLKTAGKGV